MRKENVYFLTAALIVLTAMLSAVLEPGLAYAAAAATQNTIDTTGPVNSSTTISVGSLAGEVLQWAAVAFGSAISIVLTGWLIRLFNMAGVQTTQQMRDQLQAVIVNGINSSAAYAQTNMAGKTQLAIKQQVVADTIDYVKAHGSNTIKALGLDPNSGEAVSAIKARIETALVDPATPTNPIVTPNAGLPPQK